MNYRLLYQIVVLRKYEPDVIQSTNRASGFSVTPFRKSHSANHQLEPPLEKGHKKPFPKSMDCDSGGTCITPITIIASFRPWLAPIYKIATLDLPSYSYLPIISILRLSIGPFDRVHRTQTLNGITVDTSIISLADILARFSLFRRTGLVNLLVASVFMFEPRPAPIFPKSLRRWLGINWQSGTSWYRGEKTLWC